MKKNEDGWGDSCFWLGRRSGSCSQTVRGNPGGGTDLCGMGRYVHLN